ncbi:MAG: hypothetical protein ACJAY8_000212 [Sphingobacteriales bacterium]|jgi:hypothetical protein
MPNFLDSKFLQIIDNVIYIKILHILAKSKLGNCAVWRIVMLVCMGMASVNAEAQELQQWAEYDFSNGAYLPAKAGDQGWQRFFIMRRDQWVGFPGSPKSTLLGWNGNLGSLDQVGVYFLQDKLGIQSHQRLSTNKSISLGSFLGVSWGAGINLGYQWSSITTSGLEQFDPALDGMTNQSSFIIGAGFGFSSETFVFQGSFLPSLKDDGRKEKQWLQFLDWKPRFLSRKSMSLRSNIKMDLGDVQIRSASLTVLKDFEQLSLGLRIRSEGAVGVRVAISNTNLLPGPIDLVFNAELIGAKVENGPILYSNEIGIAYRFTKMVSREREGHKTVRYL